MDGGKLSAHLELVEGAEPEKMKKTNKHKAKHPSYEEFDIKWLECPNKYMFANLPLIGKLLEDEENLPKTKAEDSKQKNLSKGHEMDKIVDLPRKQQHPSLISKLCLGGSHERCINDKEEGCGALEHLSSQHDSYVKCVHHCVEHCKRKI